LGISLETTNVFTIQLGAINGTEITHCNF